MYFVNGLGFVTNDYIIELALYFLHSNFSTQFIGFQGIPDKSSSSSFPFGLPGFDMQFQ